MTTADVLTTLAGLTPEQIESWLGHRIETREAAEASLAALFDVAPEDSAPDFMRAERLALAAHAAQQDGAPELADFYLEQLDEEAEQSASDGVAFGAGIDSWRRIVVEGADGATARGLPRRARIALRHTELLIHRPAATTADDLEALARGGWSVTETVVLSQIVSFVSYQVRAVQGLRVVREVLG